MMMGANISFGQLRPYLGELQEKGLIEKKVVGRNSTLYIATAKGQEFLETYDMMKQMLASSKPAPVHEKYSTVKENPVMLGS